MTDQFTTKRIVIELGICLVVLTVSLWIGVRVYLQEKLRVGTCGDFSSYEQVQKAFSSGNLKLDADQDGVPCEELL